MLNKENEQIRNEIIEMLANGSTPGMDKETKKLCKCSEMDCTHCAFFSIVMVVRIVVKIWGTG